MKLSHKELTGHVDSQRDSARREAGIISKTLARCAIIGAFAFASPLLSGTAHAQQPGQGPVPTAPAPAVPASAVPAAPVSAPSATARPEHRVRGETTALTDGSTTRNAYIVIRDSPAPSSIEVEGPARLTVRFYTVIDRSRFATPTDEVPRSITYSVGPTGGAATSASYEGSARMSGFTNQDVGGTLAIGTGIDMVINVAAGRQVVTFPGMNGFFEVISVEPPPAPRPIQPAQPARPIQPPAQPAAPAAAYEYGEVDNSLRPVFSLEFARTALRALGTQGTLEDGSAGNSGDIYNINALGTIRLSDRFGLIVGGMFNSYGLRLVQPQWETGLRGYSADLAAGVSFQQGGHYAYAVGFGGWRGIGTSIQSFSDGRTLDAMGHMGEFGGMAGYDYSRYVRLRVSGSNNPFNPLSVRLFGALPYTWTPGVFPYVEADFLWLHALAPVSGTSQIGLVSVSENAFHFRALAGVPIWRLGPVVPLIVGGGEFNAAGGGITGGTGIFGGGLRTDFVRGLDIDLVGAATLHGDPLLFFKLAYSR
ncbi:hypothetical protein L0Y65_04075 [Candidatus Micrarchaeota archaeon]|nr:hypothetical protein [Candidatus Micrarchaeota archaeon]